MTSFVWAEPTPVGPIGFGKGIDLLHTPDTIDDQASSDMCNCLSTLQGAAIKRNGSKRYINQAISSFPVTSLYNAYASTSGIVVKTLIATNRDKILISTNTLNPLWTVISSNNFTNQHYSFVTMNKKVLMAGDGMTENVKQYDIINSSIADLFQYSGDSSAWNVRPKYQIVSNNYWITYNITVSTSAQPLATNTTYYPSRIAYSLLNTPSSMTVQRFIDFKTEDGEEGTGIGEMNARVNFFKPSSIGELSWTNALDLSSRGGDFVFDTIVNGFGCIAPRTLVNTGQAYIFLSKDGVRLWDGGRRSILDTTQGSKIISYNIKPIIDRVIAAGTYKNAVGIFYPKRSWYILSFEDPTKFPQGKNNTVMVYDLILNEWFPFCNWLADSFSSADNAGDTGKLYYGDSADGYVHLADVDTQTDDSRKEIVLDTMDNNFAWSNSSQDVTNVMEGTASAKVSIYAKPVSLTESSMTNVNVFQMGEWYDRTKASKSDKLAFKAFVSSLPNISYLRIDMEVNLGAIGFDTNFTSITFTSAAFTGGDLGWTNFEIALSSFPQQRGWTDFASDKVPFANTPTYYGIRFVLGGIDISSVSIDDLRFIQSTQNPVKFYRFSKLFNMESPVYKGFGSLLLTREKFADSGFFVDVYNDFGQAVRTFPVKPDIPKEIFVTGFSNSNNLTALNSIDYSVIRQTSSPESVWSFFNGAADNNYIYMADRTNDRMIKIDRTSFTFFISSYGTFGSGTTSQNLMAASAVDDNYLYFCDLNNERIKQHSKNDLSFYNLNGSLGIGSTNYNEPSGISVNNNSIIVSEDGNQRLTMVSKSTLGVILQVPVDFNTLANSSIQNDEKYLYLAYNKVNESYSYLQDLILERRDIGNLGLIQRIRVVPSSNISVSTSILMGEIALLGKYIYIPFTDSLQESTANYYIQKRLKSDFSIVSEYKTPSILYSVIGDGLSYKPSISTDRYDLQSSGKYIQLKFYDDPYLENNFKLFNMTFMVNPTPATH